MADSRRKLVPTAYLILQMPRTTQGLNMMTARYGTIYKLTDFIDRTLPKRGIGSFDQLFLHQVTHLLKTLDRVQGENPWVTLSVQAGGYIALYYKGSILL